MESKLVAIAAGIVVIVLVAMVLGGLTTATGTQNTITSQPDLAEKGANCPGGCEGGCNGQCGSEGCTCASGGSCPCGCNGQCNGECGKADCTCNSAVKSAAAPACGCGKAV